MGDGLNKDSFLSWIFDGFKMRYIIVGFIGLLFGTCQQKQDHSRDLPEIFQPKITDFPLNCSIRALEAIDENSAWFAGSGGYYGFTTDGGLNWHIDSIKINNQALEFRAISITSQAVLLLNVGSPAHLLKSIDEGKNWSIVYRETHPKIFYNSMKFWNDQHGIAVGDPIDGCLSVIVTKDGGNSWKKLGCDVLPPTFEGEAGFAASNTNIAIDEQHAWLVSGGQKARIFHTPDFGKTWEVFNTPIVQGGKMTGIFSVDFFDENKGIIFGGDWEDQADNTKNKAVTFDGGNTWQLICDGDDPGYRSCVQFIANTDAQGMIAVGIPGISYSRDSGNNWQHIASRDFYTIRIVEGTNVAWLAGKNKIARLEW